MERNLEISLRKRRNGKYKFKKLRATTIEGHQDLERGKERGRGREKEKGIKREEVKEAEWIEIRRGTERGSEKGKESAREKEGRRIEIAIETIRTREEAVLEAEIGKIIAIEDQPHPPIRNLIEETKKAAANIIALETIGRILKLTHILTLTAITGKDREIKTRIRVRI